MGLFGKKDKENEQISTEAQEVTQGVKQREEAYSRMAYQVKKKYMYIALDREGEVLLDKTNSPYFSVMEEGGRLQWSPEIAGNVTTDPELRVELAEIDSQLSKSDREKAKREVRNNAKEKLKELAADKIQSAIAKKEQNRNLTTEKILSKIEDKGIDGIDSINGKTGQEGTTKMADVVESETKEDIASAGTDRNNQINSETEKEVSKVEESNDKHVDELPEKVEILLAGVSQILETIRSAEKNLNQDFMDFVDVVQESVGKTGNENVEEIKRHTESEVMLLDGRVKRCAEDSIQFVADRTQKATENVIGRINETSRTLKEGQKEIAFKTNSVDRSINDIRVSVEGIEGRLHRLDQLDNIAKLLQDKGLVMSMDIPPVNADEEDIVNLVRYSQKITEQLGYAARDLIRKQAVFRSQAQNNENEQSILEQKIAAAHDEGVKEGQKIFIKQLVSKYADIDAIKDSDDGHIHVIWALLMELGAKIDADGNFEKGKEVIVSGEEAHKMVGTYTGINGSGKYKVLKTGLVFSGEIVYRAEFRKIETHQEGPEEQINQGQ